MVSHLMLDFFNSIDTSIILPAILSSLVLITLFVIGRFLDSLVERKRNAQEWYMKMVLEPNFNTVNEFFKNFFDQTMEISKKHSEFEDDFELKIQLYDGLVKEKRKLEFNFILLVSNPYPKTAGCLTRIINEVQDCSLIFLDSEDYSVASMERLEKEIMEKKGQFFNEIYQPFRIKSIAIWFKKNYLMVAVIFLFIAFVWIIGFFISKDSEENVEQGELASLIITPTGKLLDIPVMVTRNTHIA